MDQRSKIVGELGDRVAQEMLLAKMFFLINLVVVVLITELSGLSLKMIQIRKLLEHPEPVIKPAVKTFDVRDCARLTERDENNLYPKVQTEAGEFAECARVDQAASGKRPRCQLKILRLGKVFQSSTINSMMLSAPLEAYWSRFAWPRYTSTRLTDTTRRNRYVARGH